MLQVMVVEIQKERGKKEKEFQNFRTVRSCLIKWNLAKKT